MVEVEDENWKVEIRRSNCLIWFMSLVFPNINAVERVFCFYTNHVVKIGKLNGHALRFCSRTVIYPKEWTDMLRFFAATFCAVGTSLICSERQCSVPDTVLTLLSPSPQGVNGKFFSTIMPFYALPFVARFVACCVCVFYGLCNIIRL